MKPSNSICDICGEIPSTFQNKTSYLEHYKMHSQDTSINCDQCNKSFPTKLRVRNHIKFCHKDKIKCTNENCTQVFVCSGSYKRHIDSVHGHSGEFKCEECGKTFPGRKDNLKRHKEKIACKEGTDEKILSCEKCEKSFKTIKILKQHSKTHEVKIHKCSECEKTFSNITSLTSHTKLHLSKEECNDCHKVFSSKFSLQRHSKSHKEKVLHFEDERNFFIEDKPEVEIKKTGVKCNFCMKTFSRNFTMKRHQEMYHQTSYPEAKKVFHGKHYMVLDNTELEKACSYSPIVASDDIEIDASDDIKIGVFDDIKIDEVITISKEPPSLIESSDYEDKYYNDDDDYSSDEDVDINFEAKYEEFCKLSPSLGDSGEEDDSAYTKYCNSPPVKDFKDSYAEFITKVGSKPTLEHSHNEMSDSDEDDEDKEQPIEEQVLKDSTKIQQNPFDSESMGPNQCNTCRKDFTNQYTLERHLKKKHL